MKKMLIMLIFFMLLLSIISSSVVGREKQEYEFGIENENHTCNSINFMGDTTDSFVDWIEVNKIFPLDHCRNNRRPANTVQNTHML